MNKKITILFIFLLTVSFLTLNGQKYHTNSTRALNAYNAGKKQYEFLSFESAEKLLKEAVSIDKNFYEPYVLLGELFFKTRRFKESAAAYQQAVRIDSLFYKPLFFELASAELYSGQYQRAAAHFRAYLELNKGNEKNREFALKAIDDCGFAIEAMKNPVPFNPVNLGDSVNTRDDEYWPSITVDGSKLLFTRQQRTKGQANMYNQEDFFISLHKDGGWGRSYNAGPPLNTPQNEGAQSVSPDGSGIYYTACDRPGGMGRCDIYFSSFDGVKWSNGKNLGGPVNSNYWEAQPSISSNGRMLFFSSNRPGGEGGMDIWFSVLNAGGIWTTPRNAGKEINTKGDEMSPFIHFDGVSLYFSSNGSRGMGGFDLFYSRMKRDTTWTDPVNMGYPVNTFNDELGLIIDASGAKAYFSSVRDEKAGKDIFSFELYAEARPSPVSYFRGSVFDSETGRRLKAEYELVELQIGQIIAGGSTGVDGNFLVCLPAGSNYGLNVSRPGYLFYSDNFMLEGIHTVQEPFIKRVILYPLKTGVSVPLYNVFFEIDSWELKPESKTELKRLYRLLADNKDVKVEIAGYTDSTGTMQHNQVLSEKRAKSVVDYIIQQGIAKERLSFRGYGSSQPVADNITPEGRRMNRRTEVKITADGRK